MILIIIIINVTGSTPVDVDCVLYHVPFDDFDTSRLGQILSSRILKAKLSLTV